VELEFLFRVKPSIFLNILLCKRVVAASGFPKIATLYHLNEYICEPSIDAQGYRACFWYG
jgi:hypothetical protein